MEGGWWGGGGGGGGWRFEITGGGATSQRCWYLGVWGRGGICFVWVELLSGVVPRDRKSGGYVSLDMGHSFVKGYHWS